MGEKTCQPGSEQDLALGAGLHAMVDGIPESAYPIRSWEELLEAADALDDVSLITPGGEQPLLREVLPPNVRLLRRILGDQYLPLEGKQDFARKAGEVLMVLIVRKFGPPSSRREPDESTAAEIDALKRDLAARKAE